MKGCLDKESLPLRWMGQIRASEAKLLKKREKITWPVAFNVFYKVEAKDLFRQ